MRVLTFNLLALQHADGRRRHELVKRRLGELRPDVVALQEVTRTETFDQAADLLGPDFSFVDTPSPSPDGVGACVGSRWPLGEVQVLDLHVTPRAVGLPWAAAVAVEVQAPAPLGPVLVVHHKPNWQRDREDVREQQAVATTRFVDRLVTDRPELPVVVLGDFDAGPDSASMRFWTGRQSLAGAAACYEDAWEALHPHEPGHTFTPGNHLVQVGEMPLERGRRIDHVLTRCGAHGPLLEVTACQVVFDTDLNGLWPSDHFGVLADYRAPAHPPGSWA